jgi:glutaconate CoA-transferase, subunit A
MPSSTARSSGNAGTATVPDKRATIEEVVGELRDGMTIGIGGWGSRRKPMALVRALCRSSVKDLTLVSYGGPDVGLLCATGKVRKVVFAFVSLDSIALEPHFRNAMQAGAVETLQLDEGMFLLGLQAAAWRVPFLPTRVGLGSDVLDRQREEIRTVVSPYVDPETGAAEELVAMPALRLDVALVHQNRADAGGNAQFLGPDLYFDDLMCQAAQRSFVTCERLVDTGDLLTNATRRSRRSTPPARSHPRRGSSGARRGSTSTRTATSRGWPRDDDRDATAPGGPVLRRHCGVLPGRR